MAVQDITYTNKVDLNETKVADINKVKASDMNEIKSVVNNNGSELTNLQGKIIWTNSNPTSSFASQTINLDESLNNYNSYEIIFRQSVSASRYFSTGKIPVGNGTILGFLTSATNWRPTGTTVSGSTITFEDGRTGNTVDNSYLIPIYVIGYKGGLNEN